MKRSFVKVYVSVRLRNSLWEHGLHVEIPVLQKSLLSYVRDVQPTLMEDFVNQGSPDVVAAMRTTITNMLVCGCHVMP